MWFLKNRLVGQHQTAEIRHIIPFFLPFADIKKVVPLPIGNAPNRKGDKYRNRHFTDNMLTITILK